MDVTVLAEKQIQSTLCRDWMQPRRWVIETDSERASESQMLSVGFVDDGFYYFITVINAYKCWSLKSIDHNITNKLFKNVWLLFWFYNTRHRNQQNVCVCVSLSKQ